MKHIFTIVFAVLATGIAANAQEWSFGPKVGMTFSTVNGVQTAEVREGMVAGVFAERAIGDMMSMQADLLFSQHGYDLKTDPKTRYRVDYLSLPIVSKYYLFDNFNFQLGGQFEYLLGAKEKVSGQSTRSIRNNFNRYNISFIAGLAYDFDFGLVVEGRYFYGLTQLTPLEDNSRTGYLQLSLGYRFW